MNKKTKLINEIVDLILAKGLLNEIGEGTSTYPIKNIIIEPGAYAMEFNVIDNTGDVIDVITVYGSIDIEDYELPFPVKSLYVNFKSEYRNHNKTDSKYPLKVMSTVVNCVKKVLNSTAGRGVNMIAFSVGGSSSKEIHQKKKLYAAYLQKNLHSIKGRTFIEPSKESREILDDDDDVVFPRIIAAIGKDLEIKIIKALTQEKKRSKIYTVEPSRVSAVELETDLKDISGSLRTIGEIFNAYEDDSNYQKDDFLRNVLDTTLSKVNAMSFSFRKYSTGASSIDLSNDWRRDDGTIDIKKVSKWFAVQSYLMNRITATVKTQVNDFNDDEYSNFMRELDRLVTQVKSGIFSLQHILSFP